MKIFLLSQDVNNGYDTYDEIVVAAENADDAVKIAPDGAPFKELPRSDRWMGTWAFTLNDIKCKEIGEAKENIERGVICTSFRAG